MTLDRRMIARFAFWLALAYAAALSGPYFYLAIAGSSALLGGGLIAATWTASPVYIAAAFVAHRPTGSALGCSWPSSWR